MRNENGTEITEGRLTGSPIVVHSSIDSLFFTDQKGKKNFQILLESAGTMSIVVWCDHLGARTFPRHPHRLPLYGRRARRCRPRRARGACPPSRPAGRYASQSRLRVVRVRCSRLPPFPGLRFRRSLFFLSLLTTRRHHTVSRVAPRPHRTL